MTITSTGIVKVKDCLNVRSEANTSYSVVRRLSNGSKVTILDVTTNGWLRIKATDGTTGYCGASYVGVQVPSNSRTRNLNNIDKSEFISKLSKYHHAAGKCYSGILYRRYDELEVFLYGDYTRDGSSNKHGFARPSCMK